jgi:serine/threonine protein kinase
MLAPDTLLQNRYRIKRQLAQGGMGAIYEAEAVHLGGTTVAVKETFFAEERLRQQFQREAALLAKLKHPALPKVSDHFSEGAGQFLVMEFIPGRDLFSLLNDRGQPFEASLVMQWTERLLDALDYIHTQNPPVIHRDVKPENLKITERGELFLLDFGLARNATTPTRAGGSLHAYTLAYASPEQLKATGTDARSDLYSLGATLYHLLTGDTPPDAKLREEVVRRAGSDPLDDATALQTSAPLQTVILKAMALKPADRYQSAAAMRQAMFEEQRKEEARLRQEQEQRRAEEERRRREKEAQLQAERERLQRENAELQRRLTENQQPTLIVSPVGRRNRLIAVAAAAAVLIGVSSWLLSKQLQTAQTTTPPGVVASSVLPGSSPPPSLAPERAEVLRYQIRWEKPPAGGGLRILFTPRASGFLWLLGLTEQKAPIVLRSSMALKAGVTLQYPDSWYDIAPGENAAQFTVIFSPAPLTELSFLNKTGREMTAEDQSRWQEFGKQFAHTAPQINTENGSQVVTAQQKSDEPLVFNLVVSR